MVAVHGAIVHTIPNRCRKCYACVRHCPAQAIKIQEGQAQVVKERCISCGTCTLLCSQKAKYVRSDIRTVDQLLSQNLPVIATLSSSFPAAFPDATAGQLVAALKKLGFTEVMEVAFGAELVARAYRNLISEDKERPFIFTACSAVVDFIEKFYPQLIKLAAPIVSPTIAMGRVIKRKYNPRAKVVYIGACIAKKTESQSEAVGDAIDAVLTFVELKKMLALKGIVPSNQEESEFSGPKPNLGRMYAVPGGLLKMVGLVTDVMKNDVVVAEGRERVLEILKETCQGAISARLLELLFCEGCINGPMLGNNLCFLLKKEIITEYTLKSADPARTEYDIAQYADVDLSRSFTPSPVLVRSPNGSELHHILAQMNKKGIKDELNCGACGYQTCRELATAIFQGLAEKEMCWPYLMETLKTSQKQLTEAENHRFYLEYIARALEEERKHIARELHDSVVQTLIAMLHQVENFLEAKTYLRIDDTQFLLNLSQEIRSVLQQIRQFSLDLRPAILDDLGLVPTLAWLARQQQIEGVETQFRVIGTQRRFSADVELALFRVAQEALRNVSRHSSASQTQMILEFNQNKATLTIADNGRGFAVPADLKELPQLGKLGLIGMQERVRLSGGRLRIKSEIDKGTTIIVEVPV